MGIISVETAISQLVHELGYYSQVAQNGKMKLLLDQLPAAIIYNSTMVDKVGREQCRLTTKVKLKLIKSGVSCSQEAKNDIVLQMRCDAIDVMNRISSYANIVDVTGMKLEVDDDYMARCDDVSLVVEATVVSNYNALAEGVQLL